MRKKKHLSPFTVILLSFLIVIVMGTFLLLLPFSTTENKGLTFVEAFFTSTSAVCVTGLSVIPDIGATLSVFGKIVLAILIEIGGLGFITITVFVFIILGIKVGFKNKFLLREALNQDSTKGMNRMVLSIVAISFTIQALGAIVNFFILKFDVCYPGSNLEIFGLGLFHTISSFNNAGFDLFGSQSLCDPILSDSILFNINTMILIVVGGIGFIVILDILSFKSWKKLSLHTKIVLSTTICLILFGALLLVLLTDMTIMEAFFQSVSARTAGFATYDMSQLRGNPAFIIFIMLMFIGASPCSTGGGVKTTTFFVLVASIIGYALGKKTTAFKRHISSASIMKAFTLVVMAIIFVFCGAVVISVIEQNFGILKDASHGMDEIIFETFSAFGTVGNSTGITPVLHPSSKLILCVIMFTGRLGPLTIMNLWNRNWLTGNTGEIKYVEKNIIIG